MNGSSEVVKILLKEGADPMLRARACKEHWCRRGYDSPCRGWAVPEVPEDYGTLPSEIAVRRHHTLCAQLVRRHVTEERARYYEPEVWSPDLDKRKLRASEAQSPGGAKPLTLPPLRFEARFHRACADGDFASVVLMIDDFDARCAVLLDEGPAGTSVLLDLPIGGEVAGGDGPDGQGSAMNTSDVYNQVTKIPRVSLGFLATRAAFVHPCTTAAARAATNGAPTLSTRSPPSESPVKPLTNPTQNLFFCIP